MKRWVRKSIARLMSAAIMVTTCTAAIPQSSMVVNATPAGKSIVLGSKMLGTNVNTVSGATVYYGYNKYDHPDYDNYDFSWSVIGYNNEQGSVVAVSDNTATLLAANIITRISPLRSRWE